MREHKSYDIDFYMRYVDRHIKSELDSEIQLAGGMRLVEVAR